MLALGIRYLTGYSSATLARNLPEWPPHPGRVFMAMAAGYFQTGEDPEERAALEWLETLGAPSLRASEADIRTETRAYVPVNDDHGGIVSRLRQDRGFWKVRPHEDRVYVLWPEAHVPTGCRTALERVCYKVTRVGHSSSAVQMWLVGEGEAPEANWQPDPLGAMRMRIAERGTLEYLESAFGAAEIARYNELQEALAGAKGKELKRLKSELATQFPDDPPKPRSPQLGTWQGYRRVSSPAKVDEIIDGPFDPDILIFSKREGTTLGLESTAQVTGALRRLALAGPGRSAPEWLSGHQPTGEPSLHPHVSFFPLPFVGREHADGHIMGVGMAIPRGVPDAELKQIFGRMFFDQEGVERELSIGRREDWQWDLERERRERPPLSLRRNTWTGPSRYWGSVTPVVLHHHPKKRPGDVERILREAFESALLPAPADIRLRPVSIFQGAGHARELPPFSEGGPGMCRYQTHVVAEFDDLVRGPMLVGRGRFRGYGLLRPCTEEEFNQWRS